MVISIIHYHYIITFSQFTAAQSFKNRHGLLFYCDCPASGAAFPSHPHPIPIYIPVHNIPIHIHIFPPFHHFRNRSPAVVFIYPIFALTYSEMRGLVHGSAGRKQSTTQPRRASPKQNVQVRFRTRTTKKIH